MGFAVSFLLYPIDRDWAEEVPGYYHQLVESFDFFAVVPNSRTLHQNARGYHHGIDEWWDDNIAQQLTWLFQRKKFDVFLVNYTFLTKAFEYAPPGSSRSWTRMIFFPGGENFSRNSGWRPSSFTHRRSGKRRRSTAPTQ